MQITDLIILILVVIDVVSLSMVSFIFRWARKAMENFRIQIMDLLSGENDESVAIIEKLGHTIYQKLYRYFNLNPSKIPNLESGQIPADTNDILDKFPALNPSPSSSIPGAAEMAKQFGIDPKFLPILLKAYGMFKGGQSGESINTGNDYW